MGTVLRARKADGAEHRSAQGKAGSKCTLVNLM